MSQTSDRAARALAADAVVRAMRRTARRAPERLCVTVRVTVRVDVDERTSSTACARLRRRLPVGLH